jgi:hypothetical protein
MADDASNAEVGAVDLVSSDHEDEARQPQARSKKRSAAGKAKAKEDMEAKWQRLTTWALLQKTTTKTMSAVWNVGLTFYNYADADMVEYVVCGACKDTVQQFKLQGAADGEDEEAAEEEEGGGAAATKVHWCHAEIKYGRDKSSSSVMAHLRAHHYQHWEQVCLRCWQVNVGLCAAVCVCVTVNACTHQ